MATEHTEQGERAGNAERLSDVARLRERRRRIRLIDTVVVMAALAAWSVLRIRDGQPVLPLPQIDPLFLMPAVFFALMAVVAIVPTVVAGRSPHIVIRPEDIKLGFDDVVGIGPVREEVRRTLDVFLSGPNLP